MLAQAFGCAQMSLLFWLGLSPRCKIRIPILGMHNTRFGAHAFPERLVAHCNECFYVHQFKSGFLCPAVG